MNAESLLTLYDGVADAPDAIERLRKLILDLAVRGKLVPQVSEDEHAKNLLEQIESERARSLGRGQRARAAIPLPIDVGPYQAPSGWVWMPLGNTGNIFTGNSINASTRAKLESCKSGRPFIATKDIGYGFDAVDYRNGMLVPETDETFRVARAPSVLICAEGGSAGRKIALTDRDISFGNKLLANETWSVVLPRFVMFYYLSETFYAQFSDQMTGIIGGISINKFLQLPFPLPPLPEQHRIVAKVDELMALCDQVESARATREATRDRLARASLARVNAPDPETFQADACFMLDALPALSERTDQIQHLRQTIVNCAALGRLVPQNSKDQPMQQVLSRLAREDATRKVRRGVPEATEAPASILAYHLPPSWCLASVAMLLRSGGILDVKDGNHGSNHPKASDFVERGLPFITAAQVSDGGVIDYVGAYKLSGVPLSKLRVGFAKSGDVIYTHKGSVGRVAVCDRECVLSPQTTYYRPHAEVFSPEYLRLLMLSDFVRLQADEVKKQTTRDFVSIQKQYDFWLVVPPRKEQERIATKAAELLSLADELEMRLGETVDIRRKLLEALLHGALHYPAKNQEGELADAHPPRHLDRRIATDRA